MRRLLLALLAALAVSPLTAQARLFTQPELDALVAPIALYPDGLVSDVLVAATHPDEVFAAAQLPKDAPAEESWDPAVKSLLSYPEVLQRMAESQQWTRDLGEAFLAQEPHVMDTVQSLRRRAQAQGSLKSTDQITVQQQDQAIVVQPRSEVVYVPYYDPYVVYGPWWWPAYQPVFWRPWAPFYVSAGFFWSTPVWHAHRVVVVDRVTHVTKTVNVQRNFVNRPQHGQFGGYVSRDYHRVPESMRRPIVNSTPQVRSDSGSRPQSRGENRPQFRGEARPPHSMPAAPRFSESRPPQEPRVSANTAPRPAQAQGGAPRGGGQMRGGGGGGGGGGGQHAGGGRGGRG